MAVTVTQLAAALRIGDGATAPEEPQLSILNRLHGVADAFVTLLASTAPEAVRDEATIRMASYLYDQPTTSRGDSYANAWINSGAGSLLARWTMVRHTTASEVTAPEPVPGTGGNPVVSNVAAEALADNTDPWPLSKIPSGVMLDDEFTAAAVRGLLGLTSAEVDDLLTGATISGNVITVTKNDGTTETITLPAGMATADGVVASGAFDATGTTLTLTLSTGATVDVDVPSLLRSVGGGRPVLLGTLPEWSEDQNFTNLQDVGILNWADTYSFLRVIAYEQFVVGGSKRLWPVVDFVVADLLTVAGVPANAVRSQSNVISHSFDGAFADDNLLYFGRTAENRLLAIGRRVHNARVYGVA